MQILEKLCYFSIRSQANKLVRLYHSAVILILVLIIIITYNDTFFYANDQMIIVVSFEVNSLSFCKESDLQYA